jgi:hypothetical protein
MTCATTALFVLWLAVKRLGLIPQAAWRLLLLFVLATEFGMIFAYRTGRYDGFGCLLMAVLTLIMSIRTKRMRHLSLFSVCLFLPWSGPQYLVALFAAAVVLALFFRMRYWVEIATSFLACAVGGIGFLTVIYLSGRLQSYRDFLSIQQRSGGFISELVLHGKLIHHNFLPKDFSLPFLIAGGLILFVSLRKKHPSPQFWSVCFGLAYCVVLTGLLISVAKFPTYYSYLIAIPLSVGMISGLSAWESARTKVTTLALCFMTAAAGAGLNGIGYATDTRDHKYSLIENFTAETLRADDIAYVDPQVYLAARQRASDVYFPNPDSGIIAKMSQAQKDSITVLLIPPDWIPDTTLSLGGNWQMTGQELVPGGHSILGNNNLGFVSWTLNDLKVARRQPFHH